MEITTTILIIGFIAGFLGTLAGGVSLITLPALMFLGINPTIAIASNRIGVLGVTIAGFIGFKKEKLIDYKLGIKLGIISMIGAFLGANLIISIPTEIQKKLVGTIMLLLLALTYRYRKTGLKIKKEISKKKDNLGIIIGFLFGIYSGLSIGGSGILFSYLLILLYGETFLLAAGTRKILFLITAIAPISTFIIHNLIDYNISIPLFISSSIGSYIGARNAKKINNKIIKQLFTIIVITMSIKLITT